MFCPGEMALFGFHPPALVAPPFLSVWILPVPQLSPQCRPEHGHSLIIPTPAASEGASRAGIAKKDELITGRELTTTEDLLLQCSAVICTLP